VTTGQVIDSEFISFRSALFNEAGALLQQRRSVHAGKAPIGPPRAFNEVMTGRLKNELIIVVVNIEQNRRATVYRRFQCSAFGFAMVPLKLIHPAFCTKSLKQGNCFIKQICLSR